MNDKSKEANHIQETTKNSMQEPSAEVKAKIDELLADDPRLKYPYMSRHEYRKMMEEREK